MVARENVTPRAPGINQTGLHKFPNRGKTNRGKSLSRRDNYLKKNEKKSLTSFSISECAVVGAEDGLRIK